MEDRRGSNELRYEPRKTADGWAVVDTTSGCIVVDGEVRLDGLDAAAADEACNVLNRLILQSASAELH
jgi:hypothetical protein